MVNREIDEGDRDANKGKMSKAPGGKASSKKSNSAPNSDRKIQKKIKTIERKIARLDDERKALNEKMLTETDPEEAMNLHNQITAIAKELEAAEEEWLELN